jgi:hypothetical protein
LFASIIELTKNREKMYPYSSTGGQRTLKIIKKTRSFFRNNNNNNNNNNGWCCTSMMWAIEPTGLAACPRACTVVLRRLSSRLPGTNIFFYWGLLFGWLYFFIDVDANTDLL